MSLTVAQSFQLVGTRLSVGVRIVLQEASHHRQLPVKPPSGRLDVVQEASAGHTATLVFGVGLLL